ncbi:MAG: hypothetical protein LBR41_00285, partial [Rickettsiales bacterium]|nr:hypothetical protein [Rickettsiales bacterium]
MKKFFISCFLFFACGGFAAHAADLVNDIASGTASDTVYDNVYNGTVDPIAADLTWSAASITANGNVVNMGQHNVLADGNSLIIDATGSGGMTITGNVWNNTTNGTTAGTGNADFIGMALKSAGAINI